MSNNIPKINAGLFLFYVAILGNYTGNILPNSLMRVLNKNRVYQYIISFFLLLFTVNLYNEDLPFKQVVGYCFLLWVWYILTIKQYLIPSVSIILLLLISYISFNLSEDLDKKFSKLDKNNKIERQKLLNKIQTTCFYLIIIISIIGGIMYFIDKYGKYRKDSKSLSSFIFKYFFRGTGKKSIHNIG